MQFPQDRSTATRSPPLAGLHEEVGAFVGLKTTDPAQFESALQPWELLCRPQSAGPFSHRLMMLRGPGFFVYKEEFSNSASVIGLTPSGMLGIGVPRGPGHESIYWGESHRTGSAPMTLPGPLDVRIRSGHEQLVAFSSIQVLKQSMSETDYATLETLAVRRRADVPPRLLHRLASWMDNTLAVFQATPALATSPRCLCEVSDDLASHLATVARSVADQPARATTPVRRSGLRRALEYLRERRKSNTRVAQLCAVSGLSERSLQYAFKETFSMSPREFMTHRRLHLVRQALLQGGSGDCSVSTVAMDHGFYELGRFARRYRESFGELPSTTLRRRD